MDIKKIIVENCDLNIKYLNRIIESKKLNKKDNHALLSVIKANNQIKDMLQYCHINTKTKQNVSKK